MSRLAIIYLCLNGVLVVTFWLLAWREKERAGSALDFLLYGGKLALSPLVGTMVATNLSLGNMIFVCASMGYFFGWSGVFWMVVTIILLPLGYQFVRRTIKPFIESSSNFGSIHDYLAHSYSDGSREQKKKIRRLASSVSCISLVFAIAIELHLATTVTVHFLPIPQEALFVILVGLTAAYAIAAGFRSVVTTDVGQSLLILVATICGAVIFFNLPEQNHAIVNQYPFSVKAVVSDLGWPTSIGFVVIGLGWLICTPDTWQRNCAARSAEVSNKGILLASAILVVLVALFSIAGMMVKTYVEPSIASGASLSQGEYPLRDLFFIHGQSVLLDVLLAIVGMGLLMAAVSTCDTFLVVAAHSIAVDYFPHLHGQDNLPADTGDLSELTIFRARLLLGILAAIVMILWLLIHEYLTRPVAWFFVVYSFQFALLAPVVLSRWEYYRSQVGASRGIWAGVAATLIVGVWSLQAVPESIAVSGLTWGDIQSLLPVFTLVSGLAAHAMSVRFAGLRV